MTVDCELRNKLAWRLARVVAKNTFTDGKPACECCEMTCQFCIAVFIVQGRYADAADQIAKLESLGELDPEPASERKGAG